MRFAIPSWLRSVRDVLGSPAKHQRRKVKKQQRLASYRPAFENLEERTLMTASSVTGILTADNHYGLYVGDASGSNLTLIGRNETTYEGSSGSTYNWSTPETYNFSVNEGEYLYIVAWDDELQQMIGGQFTVGDVTLVTNTTQWQYKVGSGAKPTTATNQDLPGTTTLQTDITTGTCLTPTASAQNGASPWGTIAGLNSNVQFIWPDTLDTNSLYDSNYIVFRTESPIAPGNHPPTALDDSVVTDENTALTIPVGTLLANDDDPDGDVLQVTAVSSTSAHGGTVSLNTTLDTVTYTPATNYFGSDSFTYTITDSYGWTDTATVNVTVRAVTGITATLTADNHYGLYYGSANGSTLNLVGRNEMGSGGNPGTYNWSLPETWTFNAGASDYIYVLAWDQVGTSPQSWIGQFSVPGGGTLYSNATDWEYTISGANTNPDLTDGELPGTSTVQGQIAGASWANVGASTANGSSPWGTIAGIDGNAQFIWHDSLGDSSFSDDKYVIFRTKVPARTPIVTVTAIDPTAAEPGTDFGVFQFQRSGDISSSLTVSYALTGSTASSADYQETLTGSVTFAANQRTAAVRVTPVKDGLAEGTETVVVTLQTGSGYVVGAQKTGTVNITDERPFDTPQSSFPKQPGQPSESCPLGTCPIPVRGPDGSFKVPDSNTQTNNPGYSGNRPNATGKNTVQTPELEQYDNGNTLVVLTGGNIGTFFDKIDGLWVARFYGQEQLLQDSTTDTFTLIDTTGNELVFLGFGSSTPAGERGQFQSFSDAFGNSMEVVSRDSSGRPTEIQYTQTIESDTSVESYVYAYVSSGANAGQTASITMRRQTNSGPWDTVRITEYAYYVDADDFGGDGDLKSVTVKDGASNVIDVTAYRYYEGETGGYEHGLKYLFNPASYARLVAASLDPFTATDAQVAPYADAYFEYNAQQRVTSILAQGEGCAVCTGGIGTYTYSYEGSDFGNEFNVWKYKTIETRPDGSSTTSYMNYAGQEMLRVVTDVTTGLEYLYFTRYDSDGRAILTANPSAVSGYDEDLADLLGFQGGDYQYLRNFDGLITTTTYGTTSTATETTAGNVAGYIQSSAIQQGELGTSIQQMGIQYLTRTAGDSTTHVIASSTVFRNEDGTGAQTTSYAYTWFTGTTQIESLTTTLHIVSAAQNGPGTADVLVDVFDQYNRVIWSKDGDGYITHFGYDVTTGAMTEMIVDVNTSLTSDEPLGWVTPASGGLHLVTTMEVDNLGRTVKVTQPNGNVTYTVYNDAAYEMRVYNGWDTTTDTPTGPIVVYREDRPGSYTEMLTMAATPDVSAGRPTGTEAISSVQTLSRTYVSAGGQVTNTDSYFDLMGVTYSTAANIGTQDVNFYRQSFGYDHAGRQNRVVTANGTIYRTVFDGLGRVVSSWVGTNDTPISGLWSPTNNDGTANMIQVTAYEYDHGIAGDGNLTKTVQIPGGSEADRVWEYFHDWRNRQVASKGGVQTTESTDTQRPISYIEYDNLGQVIASEQYDGDGVAIGDAYSDGVPDQPSASLLRARQTFEYDDQGRMFRSHVFLVDQITGAVSTDSLTSESFFDHRGNLIKSSMPGGLVSKVEIDGAGRVVKSFTTDGGGDSTWADADDVAGDVVLEQSETEYDANGNALLNIYKRRFHDETGTGELGDATSGVKARVSFVASYFDLADRLTDTVDVGTNGGSAYTRPGTVPARSDTELVSSVTYNDAGWVENTIDPRGIVSHTDYDALGRTTRTIQAYVDGTPSAADDRTTEYTYDGNNNLLTVTAVLPGSAVQTTQYLYGVTTGSGSGVNSNDIRSAMRYPDPTTGLPSSSEQETYTVNALGQTLTATDRNGTTHTYTYDVLGRLIYDAATTLGSGVNGSVRRIDTAFDSAGRAYLFTSYADTAGTTIVNQVQREYNGLGQLTAEYQAHSGAVNISTTPKVQYAYSEMVGGANHSRLVSMTYPNGRVITYDYGTTSDLDDRISRLQAMTDGSTTLEGYSYLGLGTVVERLHPESSVDLSYVKLGSESVDDAGDQYTGLDRFDRIVDQRWRDGTTDLDRYFYTYDRDSNRTSKENALNSDLDEFYSYDLLNQLTGFTRADGHDQNWAIDAQGNFNTVTTDGVDEDRTHNGQNEITGISGATTPTYDANGSLTTDEAGRKLIFDAWNRLVEVQDASSVTLVRYSYDAHGWRITEDKGTVREFFYSAGWQVLEERTGGVADLQYVWSPVYVDAMVLRDRDTDSNGSLDERLYVAHDANFNLTALLDDAGDVMERYQYDPYGAVTIANATWALQAASAMGWVYGHQGLRFEEDTGIYWNRKRDYSPTLMRFIENDPAGMVDSTNLYSAYLNSPAGHRDPAGLWNPVKFFLDLIYRDVERGWGASPEAIPPAKSSPDIHNFDTEAGHWRIEYGLRLTMRLNGQETERLSTEISFTPKRGCCDKIQFIQVVRFTKSDGTYGFNTNEITRQTGNGWNVDRGAGFNSGYYGVQNDPNAESDLTPGSSSANPVKPAKMIDRPGGVAGQDVGRMEFYTAAVCAQSSVASEQHKVYGVLYWGFDIDRSGKFHVIQPSMTGIGPDFVLAVQLWNEQAALGDVRLKNSASQQALPTFRRD